jgi:pyrroline-5-carboxylate reductase
MAAHSFRFNIGFIGAGNMAEAICRSLITAVFYKPSQLAAYDTSEARTKYFREEFGVFIYPDNISLVEQSQTIVLAVKPQQVPQVLDQIRSGLGQDQLVISICAGISTPYLETGLGKSIPVVRVMPNTPLMIGAGTTALCRGKYATEEQLQYAKSFFASSGVSITVEEKMMDAVTALSGSGPAYFFYMIEAMVQAGMDLGFSRDEALKLAANTALGSAKMVLGNPADPQELRRKVTSPGGTTEAAIGVLESHGVKGTIIEAIKAAAKRSHELGR